MYLVCNTCCKLWISFQLSLKFSVMSNATAHPVLPVRKIKGQNIPNVITWSEGAWIFFWRLCSYTCHFQGYNQQTIKYIHNTRLPDHSPNQLERNDQELYENVFYWTTYFQSFPHTGSRSVGVLPADYPFSPICCLQWWCLYDPKTEITRTYKKTNNDLRQSIILTTAIHQSIWHAWFAQYYKRHQQ